MFKNLFQCIFVLVGTTCCVGGSVNGEDDDSQARFELLDAIERTVSYPNDIEQYHVELSCSSFGSTGDFEPKINRYHDYVEHKGRDDFRFMVSTSGGSYLNIETSDTSTTMSSRTRRMQGGRLHVVHYEPTFQEAERPLRSGDNVPRNFRAISFELMTIVSGPSSMTRLEARDSLARIVDDVLNEKSVVRVNEVESAVKGKSLKRFLVVKYGPNNFNRLEFICDPDQDMRIVTTRRAISKAGAVDVESDESFEIPFYSINTDWTREGDVWLPELVIRQVNQLTVEGEAKKLVAVSRENTKISIDFDIGEVDAHDDTSTDPEDVSTLPSTVKWTKEAIGQLARRQIETVRTKLK